MAVIEYCVKVSLSQEAAASLSSGLSLYGLPNNGTFRDLRKEKLAKREKTVNGSLSGDPHLKFPS